MDRPRSELVCQELMRHRHRVAAYLFSALPDPHAVEDILQERILQRRL